tara:strand:+ start:1359 stop:1631 length:273 start_codon:yes stop_codon:yes gene_type:complete
MVTSVVYVLIGLILCFVLYIAFRAINTGMEAKKAKKDLENVHDVIPDNHDVIPDNKEDIVKRLVELKELHEKKILSDEEFAIAKKKILDE